MLYVSITKVSKSLLSKLSTMLFDNNTDFRYSVLGGSMCFVLSDTDLSNGFLEKVEHALNKRNHAGYGTFETDSSTI